jgi:peptide chain release factor 2
MQEPDFWDDQEKAKQKSSRYNNLKESFDFWIGLEQEAEELLGMAGDESEKEFLEEQYSALSTKYAQARLEAFFSKQYDDHNAIVSIHAGAGGTDAQDWTEVLLRMYTRFAEKHNLKTETLEISKGGEAGIKSVLFEVTGHNAYGYFKSEAGVHRRVALSEFNPAHTRETSFSLVEVLPILNEEEGVKIDPKDLKIEANTASGHGGQSVNTTYSAIRITHIPTGVKVSIQNERSQHQNKEKAMEILHARLLVLEEERKAKERKDLRGEFHSPEWGSQIRSYVLHPYKLVKDHRTEFESTDPDKVLSGELDDFVEKYLETTIK